MQSTIRGDYPLSKLPRNLPLLRTRTVTSSYALSDGDGVVYVNAAGGNVTVTLPAAANRGGNSFTVVRADSTPNTSVTITTLLAGDSVNGNTNLLLSGAWSTAVLQSNGVSTWVVAAQASGAQNGALGLYGNGADGALTYDGTTTILGVAPSSSTYTLNRDVYGTTIIVNSGVTIKTNGFRMFATVALLVSGTIQNNGGNGGNATSSAVGAAGAVSASNTLGNGGAGKAGTSNAVGTAGGSVTAAVGGAGASGGSATNAGGAGGTVTNPTAAQGGVHTLQGIVNALRGRAEDNTLVLGGGGGGSGASSVATAFGGGSGAGGGVMLLAAPTLAVLSGAVLKAVGGNGGNGFGSNAGGGGGGGGGVIILVYTGANGYSNAGTVTVAGGSAGAGSGSGGSGGVSGTGTIVQIAN
jgi:hypothetical protein